MSELLSSFSSSFKRVLSEWVAEMLSSKIITCVKKPQNIINFPSNKLYFGERKRERSFFARNLKTWRQSFTFFERHEKSIITKSRFTLCLSKRGKRKPQQIAKGKAKSKHRVEFCTDIEFSKLITPLNYFDMNTLVSFSVKFPSLRIERVVVKFVLVQKHQIWTKP